jgi:hypothetical protein
LVTTDRGDNTRPIDVYDHCFRTIPGLRRFGFSNLNTITLIIFILLTAVHMGESSNYFNLLPRPPTLTNETAFTASTSTFIPFVKYWDTHQLQITSLTTPTLAIILFFRNKMQNLPYDYEYESLTAYAAADFNHHQPHSQSSATYSNMSISSGQWPSTRVTTPSDCGTSTPSLYSGNSIGASPVYNPTSPSYSDNMTDSSPPLHPNVTRGEP